MKRAAFPLLLMISAASIVRSFFVPARWSRICLSTLATRTKEWLVCGDGDLSYSATLALKMPDDTRLIASVLEPEDVHNQVYEGSKSNTAAIMDCGHQVRFGTDATALEGNFQSLNRIIFNFPHWRGKSNNRYNRDLLNGFLGSASKVLSSDGEIHVALCQGQGGQEAKSVREWRISWMAAEFAASHGLLLHRLEPYEVEYNLSSHRGVDRPFSIGSTPLLYVFGFANGSRVPKDYRICCRHELQLILDPSRMSGLEASASDLMKSDFVLKLAKQKLPDGIDVEIPLRQVVKNDRFDHAILNMLVVHSGSSQPLTRGCADRLRVELQRAVDDRIGLEINKRNRMVSKPLPYPVLDTIVQEISATLSEEAELNAAELN